MNAISRTNEGVPRDLRVGGYYQGCNYETITFRDIIQALFKFRLLEWDFAWTLSV